MAQGRMQEHSETLKLTSIYLPKSFTMSKMWLVNFKQNPFEIKVFLLLDELTNQSQRISLPITKTRIYKSLFGFFF